MTGNQRRVPFAFLMLFTFAGVAGIAMAFRTIWNEAQRVTHISDLPPLGPVPDFTLTRQDDRAISRRDLLGKVWIADFIFTRCAGPCPMMSQHMESLQKSFAMDLDLRLVSFSVDPDYDSPEVLSEYASHFNADPNRWAFITGDRNTIYDLSIKGFKLAVGKDETTDYDHMIIHSTRFVLVDRRGDIRGYYDATDPVRLAELINDTRSLLAESKT